MNNLELAPRKKITLKDILKILSPLVVIVLIVGGIYLGIGINHGVQARRLRAEIVYDFDYLLRTLEENLPTLDIIYRRNGVNLLALGQELRTALTNPAEDVNHMFFWQLLVRDFLSNSRGISHLGTVFEGQRYWLLHHYWPYWKDALPTFARYTEILSVPPVFVEDLRHVLPSAYAQENVTTEIIEEGNIAYIRIRHFSGDIDREIVTVRRFLQSVLSYQHLIIDLRGNGGGHPHYFHNLIGRMLITEPHAIYINNFYRAGSHNMDFIESMGHMRPHSTRFTLEDAMGFVTEEYAHIVQDIMRMDYHYVYRHVVEPILTIPFNGKIWMLVDEFMFSSAQLVATFYKEIDFATLVGNTTGGGLAFCNIAIYSNYIALPNSGIIVRYDTMLSLNSYGRPIEYGTDPHYFNRPGMDALETVLALIEEGWYR